MHTDHQKIQRLIFCQSEFYITLSVFLIAIINPISCVQGNLPEKATILENSDSLAAALLANTTSFYLADTILDETSLVGSPKLVKDSLHESADAVEFPHQPPSGLLLLQSPDLRKNAIVQCPWNLTACTSNQFTVNFELFAEKSPESGSTHILTLLAQYPTNPIKLWALQVKLISQAKVSVDWHPYETETDKKVNEPNTIDINLNMWNMVELTVILDTGDVVVRLNGANDLMNNAALNRPTDFRSRLTHITNENPIGILFGSAIHPNIGNGKKDITFRIRRLHLETPDSALRRKPRQLSDALKNIPKNPIQKLNSLTFDQDGFVQYAFRNRLQKTVGTEELNLVFTVPPEVQNGLIWLAESDATKSYVYLKNSLLYYTYLVIDKTGRAQLTVTEEIFLNNPLVPSTEHVLRLHRDKDILTITLDNRNQVNRTVDGRLPLIPEEGNIYLGGSVDPNVDTNGKVDIPFRGRISKAEIYHEGAKSVDLVQAAIDPKWQASVKKTGSVVFGYEKPKVNLVIAPTAAKPLTGWAGSGSPVSLTLVRDPIPITFMGTSNSIVRFDTWDFQIYRSFELEFLTYEPNGILFFVGPDRDHTDFVCVELFDGNVYFVYAVEDHYRHIQLNPNGLKINNGMKNRVYVSRNEEHRFLVKFNGQEVDVDQGTVAHQSKFSTYTYIGCVDQSSRLPWHVWSRENFAGCINSIRINNDKFLDPSTRMNQHTDVSRGIQFGVCKVPDRRCNQKTCGGGQCAERSHPFSNQLNFACDCSGADKTYREGVIDIRRSETCKRDSTILELDGETVLLIDFERQLSSLTTHTDDISLQFKTKQQNQPLFYAVSPNDKSYFYVSLQNGQIHVETNINYPKNPYKTEQFTLQSPSLGNDQWHTLRIKRRAEFIEISVDGSYKVTGKLPLQGPLQTFKLVVQQIYLGSKGPVNFGRPPPPTVERKFLPPAPRFIGDFRNFFWNEYDFIGTGAVPSKYITDLLTPRTELPPFPEWPRDPTYAITCRPSLKYVQLEKVIDIKTGGDMWLIEFKTNYDGIIFRAHEAGSLDEVKITAILLRGRLHIVYFLYGRAGVYQLVSGPAGGNLADGQWHRITIGLERRRGQIIVLIDSYPPERIGSGLPVNKINHLNFYFGGLPDEEWRSLLGLLNQFSPTSLPSNQLTFDSTFTGCLAGFSLRADKFASDLFSRHSSELKSYPSDGIVRGFCQDQKRCSLDYCQNRGVCKQISDSEIRCECIGTGYEGPRCETLVPKCPPAYCQHGGKCKMVVGRPSCNCSGTGYYGERCESSPCTTGQHCFNGGICRMIGSVAQCDCGSTGYRGDRCEIPICTPNFCLNGGTCNVVGAVTPVCDCSYTNYDGAKCEIPLCPPNYCTGHGQCVIRNRKPTCDCYTNYIGDQCQNEICPQGYCLNGGICKPDQYNRPSCDCPSNFHGSKCELVRKCPQDYCFHGGRCSMVSGAPQCDCSGTDYRGKRCEIAEVCPPEICLNLGKCSVQGGQYICDCIGTGYRGPHCNQPIHCPPDYCLHGGLCSVLANNQYKCDCSQTGRTGKHCQDDANGIYIRYESEGYIVYPIIPAVRTSEDNVTVGFKTYRQSGTLLTFLTADGQHWKLIVRDGRVMVNVNGQNVNSFLTQANDGKYHLITVRRQGDSMVLNQDGEIIRVPLTSMVNPTDESLLYTAIHIAADEKKSDIFRGIIGGVHWNGRYPIDESQSGKVVHTGDVTFVLTPSFPLPPEPQADCRKDYCMNGGRCYLENYRLKCDCSNTGYRGGLCERQSRGFKQKVFGNGVYMIYRISPPRRTNVDQTRVAFHTLQPNGPIIRVVQMDGTFYDVIMDSGKLYASFNGNNKFLIGNRVRLLNDGLMHVITIDRKGGSFNFTVDGDLTTHQTRGFLAGDGTLISKEIILGADLRFEETFEGVLGAFYWNGQYLFSDRAQLVPNVDVMKAPGRIKAQNHDELTIVLMPHIIVPTVTSKPIPLPDNLPDGLIAGGAIIPGIGKKDEGESGSIHIPDAKVFGGGAVGLTIGAGHVLEEAGSPFSLTDALLVGLLLALLLLIAALIWACWRCKPGCCACCPCAGDTTDGSVAWNNMVSSVKNAKDDKSKQLLLPQGNGIKPDTEFDQIDANPMIYPDSNIYNVDGMKVDCVLITKDSKYFVTGSSMGPPKVWNSHSGEEHHVMEGNEFGCTDLHMACGDTVLVAQVVDELGVDAMHDPNVPRVKRLQLWDFTSGRQLQLPNEIYCTATCISRKDEYVMIAQTNERGPSLLVWNLPHNKKDLEIPYYPYSPELKDAVTYLNISHDDRLVVAGFENPSDEQSFYMVFDLSASHNVYSTNLAIFQPQFIQFDAKVGATEIIGKDLAVTGTRRGELIIWSLHTLTAVDSIELHATFDNGNATILPPHNGIIHAVQLSADRRYLVTGSQDRLVRVWTMPDKRHLYTLEGHADDVLSVAISISSDIVVSGSWDGSIRVWRLSDGNQICWFTSNIEILQVKVSNDERCLIALGERNNHRKLITLQVVRNRMRTQTALRNAPSSRTGLHSPGLSPGSQMMGI